MQEAHTPRNTDARILQMMIFHATVRNLGRCQPLHRCNVLTSYCLAQVLMTCRNSAAVNVVAKFAGRGSCTIESVTIRTPVEGYNSPVAQAIVFASLG